jgi:predicted lipoprotein
MSSESEQYVQGEEALVALLAVLVGVLEVLRQRWQSG